MIFPAEVETGQCLHQSAGVISFHEPEAAGAAGDEDRGTVVYRAGTSVKMILTVVQIQVYCTLWKPT